MAFFDFLGKDVGGMQPALNDPGGLGTQAAMGNTGMTWGNLLGAAMARGAKPGSSASVFGNAVNNQYSLPPMMQPKNKKDGDMDDIMSILSIFMGIPVG